MCGNVRISGVSLVSIIFVILFSGATWNASAQKTVTYCVDPDWLPYEGIEKGQHVGISSDYVKLLEDISGYRFLLISTRSWSETLSLAQSGRCQLVPMLNKSHEREQYLRFSQPYFYSPKVLVSRTELLLPQGLNSANVESVAVIDGYRTIEYLKNQHPALDLVVVTSEQAGLSAVSEGEADVFIGSTLSVNNELFKHGLRDLKITGWSELKDELRVGVPLEEEALLADIAESLKKITAQQHADIFNAWNKVRVIDNTNYSLIWKIVAASLAMLVLLLGGYLSARKYNRQLQLKNEKLVHLQKELEVSNEELRIQSSRDALTTLYNRHYINQIIENPSYQYATVAPLALIVLDLDFFKKVNDTYGHTAGDKVLVELSRLLKKDTDESHILVRWGGEEFVIFCKQQTLEDANRLCETFQNSIKSYPFSYIKTLSCSYGVAELLPGESLAACFKRADTALYQAKANGRDRIEMASAV